MVGEKNAVFVFDYAGHYDQQVAAYRDDTEAYTFLPQWFLDSESASHRPPEPPGR